MVCEGMKYHYLVNIKLLNSFLALKYQPDPHFVANKGSSICPPRERWGVLHPQHNVIEALEITGRCYNSFTLTSYHYIPLRLDITDSATLTMPLFEDLLFYQGGKRIHILLKFNMSGRDGACLTPH